MYFQTTPDAFDRLNDIIDRRAEIEPRVVENKETGVMEERVSAHRSEVGAIDEIRMPTPADRLAFSAQENADGEIVPYPQQRLNHCDSQLPQHLDYTERYLLESGLKWTPIKLYDRNMPRGCGTTSEWKLSLKALTRAGAVYPDQGVPFALLMTITDPGGAAPIYEEVRAEILRRGLRLADITVAQRLRAWGS